MGYKVIKNINIGANSTQTHGFCVLGELPPLSLKGSSGQGSGVQVADLCLSQNKTLLSNVCCCSFLKSYKT